MIVYGAWGFSLTRSIRSTSLKFLTRHVFLPEQPICSGVTLGYLHAIHVFFRFILSLWQSLHREGSVVSRPSVQSSTTLRETASILTSSLPPTRALLASILRFYLPRTSIRKSSGNELMMEMTADLKCLESYKSSHVGSIEYIICERKPRIS